ncbi:MAG: hypothetical protein IJ688_04355, partial [Treponema sp.]|nr:hypothetical protein [Treponema sp.]
AMVARFHFSSGVNSWSSANIIYTSIYILAARFHFIRFFPIFFKKIVENDISQTIKYMDEDESDQFAASLLIKLEVCCILAAPLTRSF